MNIIPLGDRVLVREAPSQPLSSGATVLVDLTEDALQRGVVVAVGTGRRGHDGADIPLVIVAGDTIVFARDAAQELTLAGVQHWILEADSVLIIELSAPPLWTRTR